MYSLYGVVEHSGTLRSGHYTAYVKLQSSNTTSSQSLEFIQSLSPSLMSVNQLVAKLRSLSSSSKHYQQQQQQRRDVSETDDVATEPRQPCTSLASDGRWFHISDTSVSQVKLTNVLHCQAYILFYERMA